MGNGGVAMIDPVLEAIQRMEDLRRDHYAADDRNDRPEIERILDLLIAAEDAERDLEPRSPGGGKKKLLATACLAEGYDAEAVAPALRRLARDIERHGPQRRHIEDLRTCIT